MTLVLFLIIRTAVLRRAKSTRIAFFVLPVLLLFTFFINLFFILVSEWRGVCVILCVRWLHFANAESELLARVDVRQ